jgi:type IV secretion system protein VirB10
MIDDETGFEFAEDDPGGNEGPPEEDTVEGAEEPEGPEAEPGKRDAQEAVRFNKAPWINRRLIFTALAGVAAVTMVVSIVGPGNRKKNEEAEKTRNAPEVTVPDFGDYRGRAYRGEDASYPEEAYLDEMPAEYYEAMPAPAAAAAASSGPGRNAAAEREIAARGSPLIPQVQGRLLGMPAEPGYYAAPPASDTAGILSPLEYMQDRLAALSGGIDPARPASAASGGSGNSYERQNMQENKQAFYTGGREEAVAGSFIPEDTVWNGTIIPAVLITGINTDLPGDVQARVTNNIYDSLTGKKLLIPQGSILIASYNSSVSFAQERVQIAWNTLIRPDGYQAALGNMNGVDRQGFSGTKGQIDDHIFQYVKAAGIISAFTLLNGEIAFNANALANNQSLQNMVAANQGVINQLSAEIINRALDIQPTLRVKNGAPINVMINKNIRLPPLKDYPVSSSHVRK